MTDNETIETIKDITTIPPRHIDWGREVERAAILDIVEGIREELYASVKTMIADPKHENFAMLKHFNAQLELANHLYMRIALRTST